MKRLEGFVAGLTLGAGLMYLLDPSGGRRRRALIRDRFVHGRHELSDVADTTSTRVRNRMQGIVAETRSRFSAQEVDDSVLEARVRSSMGRVISNPGAIAVSCTGGTCIISGPVLASEADVLLACIGAVPGVHEIDNHLTVRSSPDGISGLQGSNDGRH